MRPEDYEAVAARAFDGPWDAELRDELRVCADALEQAGDPRGALIALEHALEHALAHAPPRRVHELRDEVRGYAIEHGLLPRELVASPRVLEPEWRAGRLHGAFLDARRTSEPGRLVELLLDAAPVLRRLHVRVRNSIDVDRVFGMLRGRAPGGSVEQLVVSTRPWPVTLQGASYRATELAARFPRLYLLALGDALQPVPIDRAVPDAAQVPAIAYAGPPTTARERVHLGRALCSGTAALRLATLARLAALGPAAAPLAEALRLLLRHPGLVEQPQVVAALRAIGPSHVSMTLLAVVASRATYDVATRKAAGSAAAEMRRALGVV